MLAPTLKGDEEAMVPRRVIPHVVVEKPPDEGQLTRPQLGLVKVREQPLPVAPGVVVLRVGLEHFLVERQLWGGAA